MMATTYSYLSLLLCLLTGGGNDLLDYALSDAFWREKKVEVSFDAMVAELADKAGPDVAALIPDLGSPNAEKRDKALLTIREAGGAATKALTEAADSPDAEVRRRARTLLRQIGGDEIERGVRRLMAIRTLGEMRKPEALPVLKPLLTSKEPFVAEYAQASIDRIDGKVASANARAPAAGVDGDVWLLPAECRTLGQLVPRRGTPLGTSELMASFKQGLAGATGKPQSDAEKEQRAADVTRMVLALADKIGNVRVDAASFGISGTLVPTAGGPDAPDPGYLAVVIRGRYHSEWARTLARSEKVPAQEVDGVEVYQPDGETAWMMPSDELFVFVASDGDIDSAIKSLASAAKAGKPPVNASGDDTRRKLIETIDTKQAVLWAAAAVTPEQKKLPVAEAFDTITLLGSREGKALKLAMTARGSDSAKVAEAVKQIDKHAKDSIEFMAGIHGISLIDLSVQLLRSVEVKAEDTTATLTAKIEATPAAILSFPDLQDEGRETPEEVPAHPRLKPKGK